MRGETVPEADPDDVRELLNYRQAFEFVSDYLDSGLPITEGLIREIHQRLVAGGRVDQSPDVPDWARSNVLNLRQTRDRACDTTCGPPTDWGEFVQVHGDRDVFQGRIDELPDINIHSILPLPDARSQQSHQAARLGETPLRRQKTGPSRGERTRSGNCLLEPGRRKHAAHAPLVSSVMVAELPLARLLFDLTPPHRSVSSLRGAARDCTVFTGALKRFRGFS